MHSRKHRAFIAEGTLGLAVLVSAIASSRDSNTVVQFAILGILLFIAIRVRWVVDGLSVIAVLLLVCGSPSHALRFPLWSGGDYAIVVWPKEVLLACALALSLAQSRRAPSKKNLPLLSTVQSITYGTIGMYLSLYVWMQRYYPIDADVIWRGLGQLLTTFAVIEVGRRSIEIHGHANGISAVACVGIAVHIGWQLVSR